MKLSWFAIIASVAVVAMMIAASCGDDPASDPLADAGSGDTDTDTDADTDSDTDSDADGDSDADADSDADVGDYCQADFQGAAQFDGTCEASSDECEAGVIDGAEQGTCADGLFCCVGDDQCELQGLGFTACEDDECSTGVQAGCPDGGWCCVSFEDTESGTVEDGDDCSVDLFGFMTLNGSCAETGSDCEGGYSPISPGGNCADGLECCLDTDQCELNGLNCQEDACEGMGFQGGCPDYGYCCQ